MSHFPDNCFPASSFEEGKPDAAGYFKHPGETTEQFQVRVQQISEYLRQYEQKTELSDLLNGSSSVPSEYILSAAEEVRTLYEFYPAWVPCFFHSGQTGHFSAGVLLEIDDMFPLICIHEAFQKQQIHHGYSITETIAHEMVHAARIGFPPSAYEEYFPCQVHQKNSFRRLAGNLFRNRKIPVLFLTGLFFGLLSILPGYTFFILFLLLPCGIILREWYLHRILNRAKDFLLSRGFRPLPVLVRMTDQEILLASKGKLERDFSRFAQ